MRACRSVPVLSGLRTLQPNCPQSYPQDVWIAKKSLQNRHLAREATFYLKCCCHKTVAAGLPTMSDAQLCTPARLRRRHKDGKQLLPEKLCVPKSRMQVLDFKGSKKCFSNRQSDGKHVNASLSKGQQRILHKVIHSFCG